MKGGKVILKKQVIVRQTEIKDCGPCCLQSVIKYYNGYVSLEKIRTDTHTSIEGTSVYHLKKALEKYGFDVVAIKNIDYTFENHLPVIVHVKYENGLCHFMVVYEKHGNKITVMDPSKGKVVIETDKFNKIFTGVLLEIYPKNNIILEQKGNNIYQLFLKIIINNKKLVLKLLFISLTLIALTIISGFYFKTLYQMINTVDSNYYIFVIYVFLVLFVLKVVYSFVRNYYLNIINKNIDGQLLYEFIQHLFRIPLKTIGTRTTGEVISRVNELWDIKNLFSQIFLSGSLDLLLSIVTLIVLLMINRVMGLILIVYIIIYIVISIVFSPYLYKRLLENIDYQTIFNTSLVENIDMINSVKNLGMNDNVVRSIEKKLCHAIFDSFSLNNTYNYFELLRLFIDELLVFIISTYSFIAFTHNEISLISIFVFNSLMAYFIDPIKNLISLVPKYNFLRASFYKICDYVDIKEENEGDKGTFKNGNIVFKNVSYSYNDYTKVINNYNLIIKQGEKVFINGPSGCGKSTLCKMITREVEPQLGSIVINDKNILDYSLKTIRSNITYVGQKEKLFTDTIKNNILFYRDNDDLFDKICKICYIDSIVDKKPLRYESGISNDAVNLSGGEKQRIVLARALLNNSKILILDEALSEVDNDLERKIIKNIMKEYPEKTLIFVSHKKQQDLFKRVVEFQNG